MGLEYLDTDLIQDWCEDVNPPTYGRTASGYGRKIPTAHRIKVKNRWRRVYVTIYSNAGTSWITVDGKRLIVR